MRNPWVFWLIPIVLPWSTAAMAQAGFVAVFQDRDIPRDAAASAPFFEAVKPLDIPLLPQMIALPNGGGTVQHVRPRAIHNGNTPFVQFTWPDPQANRTRSDH
jgi:hypothetical protein